MTIRDRIRADVQSRDRKGAVEPGTGNRFLTGAALIYAALNDGSDNPYLYNPP